MERRETTSEPYPYAQPKTHEFLLEAIREGAHKKTPADIRIEAKGIYNSGKIAQIKGIYLPEDFSKQDLAEALWIRMRNIAGARFTSPVSLEELGAQYGFVNGSFPSRDRPRQIVEKFIHNLWKNSSPELQEKFPVADLSPGRPYAFRRRERSKILVRT